MELYSHVGISGHRLTQGYFLMAQGDDRSLFDLPGGVSLQVGAVRPSLLHVTDTELRGHKSSSPAGLWNDPATRTSAFGPNPSLPGRIEYESTAGEASPVGIRYFVTLGCGKSRRQKIGLKKCPGRTCRTHRICNQGRPGLFSPAKGTPGATGIIRAYLLMVYSLDGNAPRTCYGATLFG